MWARPVESTAMSQLPANQASPAAGGSSRRDSNAPWRLVKYHTPWLTVVATPWTASSAPVAMASETALPSDSSAWGVDQPPRPRRD